MNYDEKNYFTLSNRRGIRTLLLFEFLGDSVDVVI